VIGQLFGYALAFVVIAGTASIVVSLVRAIVNAVEVFTAWVTWLAGLGERLRQDERVPASSRH
jgi:hypothetical protein